MSRIVFTAIAALVVVAAASSVHACEPGGYFAAKGGFAPSYVAAPAGFGTSGGFEAQKQLLAQQAAAYRAQRQQLRFAKAIAAREKTLADRAQRRALAIAKLHEYRRRKGLEERTHANAPQFASVNDPITR